MSAIDESRAQLVVIGAGPGGYAAAFLAADLGLDVCLIDTEPNPGGVCVYRGCIPSKALLHVARLLAETREAAKWGISFGEPEIDLSRLRDWKNEIVGTLRAGTGQLASQRKVRYLQGRATLTGPNALTYETGAGKKRTLEFEHAIVATGSSPTRIPGFPESNRVLDSSAALELEQLPGRLLVVGGGYIGLELGSVYAALGSKVTVVEMTSGLLPGVDRDLVRPLARKLGTDLDELLLETKVSGVEEHGSGVRVTLEGPKVQEPRRLFDQVLVAVGRRPNSAGLGLENTRARIDPAGFITVDARLQTDEPSIFAIGDVVGQPMLAHKASHEGRTAVHAILGEKVAFDPAAIPAVVFTDPEIAWCGLTEDQARQAGTEIAVARFPWAASGRNRTLGRTDGMTKLILDPATERILGVGIVGAGAGELIAEGCLAVEMAALASDLKLTIHPHPTLSETMMGAAEVFFGQATDIYRPKR